MVCARAPPGLAVAVGVHRIVPALYGMAAPLPEEYRDVLRSPGYLRAVFLENAGYPALAAELERLRATTPPPAGVPATVAAAYAGRPTPWAAAWLAQQCALADLLDARFAVIAPSGHLAMHAQPAQVAALIVDALSPRAESAGPRR
ncbi:alpha/beta fold hydrolase [Tsukamurella sp. PLM1]|uniref:alpha/beta fold hydrolase n=1 Tax=Tsukamurella sp. PLM1 TaxID=2929795 RepID=UPI0020532495|nr:hypothetical protein [Tsukamurella sp. PLM1]BDH55159.1 hypothetical protein MTP03_00980 [Tsukamurella sp. PLM1]